MTHDEVRKLEIIQRKLNESYEGKIRGKANIIYGAKKLSYDEGIRDAIRLICSEFVLSDRDSLVPPKFRGQPDAEPEDSSQLELPGVLTGGQP